MIIEISVFNANSVDPDKMPHSVVSDLGLYCFPFTLSGVFRLKWVKQFEILLRINNGSLPDKDRNNAETGNITMTAQKYLRHKPCVM